MDNYEFERREVVRGHNVGMLAWVWLARRLDTEYLDADGRAKPLSQWTVGDWESWPSNVIPLMEPHGTLHFEEGAEAIPHLMGLFSACTTGELVAALRAELDAMQAAWRQS